MVESACSSPSYATLPTGGCKRDKVKSATSVLSSESYVRMATGKENLCTNIN